MKFISTANFGYKTIEVLREELKKVGYQTNYWHDKFEHRAFGEIKDGNLSYEEWRDIYTSNGWVEVSEYQSCYDPKSVTSPKESASYELDKAYLTIWKIWYKYEQLWEGRLNKLDVTRFDLRRVTQAPKITIDEALFICLGLSPSVFGTPHFRPLSLYERTFEMDDIEYQDFEGNTHTINTGLYDEKGLSPIEWYLQSTEEFHLIDENEKFKCVSGRLFTKKFLKWAFKHEYLSEYEIKYRDLKDSPYGEKFAKELYDHLKEDEIISGNFDELWTWNEAFGWNSLHWLADEIKKMNLTPNKITYQFKAIEKYIDYTGDTELNQHYEPTGLEYDKKRWVEKNELIGRSLTRLELKLEKNPPSKD